MASGDTLWNLLREGLDLLQKKEGSLFQKNVHSVVNEAFARRQTSLSQHAAEAGKLAAKAQYEQAKIAWLQAIRLYLSE